MILTIQASDRDIFPGLIDDMHRLRHEVFHERLGWDVRSLEGREIDAFDEDCNPLYLLSVDDDGALRGSLRLLPTTGPNMIADVFPQLMGDDDPLMSPLIWEATRFCVTQKAACERTGNGLNYTTGELLVGLFEIAQRAGLMSIVAVYDSRMRRVLRAANATAEEFGRPQRIGNVMAHVGSFEVSDRMIAAVRTSAGIHGSVHAEDGLRYGNAA